MNFLRTFSCILGRIRDRFGRPLPAQVAQSAPQTHDSQPPQNPEQLLRQAAADALQTPHAAYENLLFRRVNEFGAVMSSAEEWHREGNSVRTVMSRTMVITEDQAIVTPEQLGGICGVCRGYIAAPIQRCAACQIPLCAVHRYKFGSEVFCKKDYEHAVWNVNTWDADPRNRRH